jgi:ubiquinone/menaquinone biosynthesis C-methylase UbiE
MTECGTSQKMQRPQAGKFTQGLLDVDLILSALSIKPGQTILDAGCGNGYMSKLFSKLVGPSGKVYSLDPNSYYIDILRNETKGHNIEAIEADITGPTCLGDSSIDLIYISTVVHIFSQKQMRGFLLEVKRLLKPNACLAIVEIEKKETPFGPPLQSRYSPEELIEMVPMAPVNKVQAGEHFYMQVFQNK